MSKNQGADAIYNAIQTVVVLVTILIAVVPLGQRIFGGDHGQVFQTLFGEQTGAAGFVIPVLIIVAAVVIILVLEPLKRRAAKK
ncbi:hypothetical protein ACFVWF_28825 [Rhodococcus qingshengii]|uniref:hypothetical protein n=1 Tax=Rhodococcus qingshengii TaxID=334542 RepID=UPI0036DB0F8F